MPRKKPDGDPSSNGMVSAEGGHTRPAFAARYIRVALAHMNELIIRGDQAEAAQVGLEIDDFLRYTFRGTALETIQATVSWIRERAQQLARLNAIELAAYDEAEARFAPPAEGDG